MIAASASFLIWGIVLHLIVDWPLQNEWIAKNKATIFPIFDNPAGWVHAGLHGAVQLLVFPWWGALIIGVTHLLIDTRKPVEWWSHKIGQTQPNPDRVLDGPVIGGIEVTAQELMRQDRVGIHARVQVRGGYTAFDIGTEVRFWTDQVFHIAVVAIVALAVTA
jgi:hypothetical protein